MKAEKLLIQIGASKADQIAAIKMAGSGRIMVTPSFEWFGSRGILGRATNREK
jgi:hypothetical protein